MRPAPLRFVAVVTLALPLATPGLAQAPVRSVVPIREVVIRPQGTPRYVITVTVNGVPMDAGVDTGSLGLRLLPRAVDHARVTVAGPADHYGYGSGVVLDGPDTTATVGIGDLKGAITLQAVRSVGCRDNKADCPANRLTPARYGLMGSGQPNQGFPAIIGVRLVTGKIPHPLVALGARRWIVHLPARGGTGALILNPDARDVAGFVPLRNGAGHAGTVAGCLMVARPNAQRICGPTLWDTGAPAIQVKNAPRPPAWQQGVAAEMRFETADGSPAPGLALQAGDPDHGGKSSFDPAPRQPGVSISAGTMPFYAYDILYDSQADSMAIRPNADQRGFPHAIR
jgi:hypothetical protein